MSVFVLFVSPGLGRADTEAARTRYEGDDEKPHLDRARVDSVAAELLREHRLRVGSEDEDDGGDDGYPRGLDLEPLEGEPGPEVRVDGSGVTVLCSREANEETTSRDLRQAAAVARSASRLLGGTSVYVPQADRMVEPHADDPELQRLAREAFAQPDPTAALGESMKRAQRGMLVLIVMPLIAISVLRYFLSGVALFAASFSVVVATAILVRHRVHRAAMSATPGLGQVGAPRALDPPTAPGPPTGAAGQFENRPIKPG